MRLKNNYRGVCPVILLALAVCLAAPAASADTWPQWRGPLASGVAPDADPPIRWSQQENIRWKVRLPGHGTGTPIIWGNQIFIQAAIPAGRPAAAMPGEQYTPAAAVLAAPAPDRRPGGRAPGGGAPGGGRGGMGGAPPSQAHQFVLMCVDRQTGQTLWQRVAREEVPHEGHHRDHGFASHSPVTDGNLIFAWFGSRGLHCYDMKGNLKWQKDFGRLRTKMTFGEGNAPALHGDTLIINWDHEGDSFVVALDKHSGDELWRRPRDEETSWATPLVVEHGGRTEVIISATSRIRSYDLKSGEQLWECAGMTANVIPSPVAGHGMVYALSGFRGNSLLAIRLGGKGALTGTDAIAWSLRRSTPYVPSPLLYGDRLYFFSGNNGVLSCHNALTGEALFDSQRVTGLEGVYASPVGAGERVYLVGRNGTTVVIRNSGNFEVLATNVLDEPADASPAIVGRELFLRGRDHLYCIAVK
jgi:outer membrane protein assembly factor BamB